MRRKGRVASTPEAVGQLMKLGFDVSIESGAGVAASFDDDAYRRAGATVTADAETLWSSSRHHSQGTGPPEGLRTPARMNSIFYAEIKC